MSLVYSLSIHRLQGGLFIDLSLFSASTSVPSFSLSLFSPSFSTSNGLVFLELYSYYLLCIFWDADHVELDHKLFTIWHVCAVNCSEIYSYCVWHCCWRKVIQFSINLRFYLLVLGWEVSAMVFQSHIKKSFPILLENVLSFNYMCDVLFFSMVLLLVVHRAATSVPQSSNEPWKLWGLADDEWMG